jgi:hypothetical protein
MRWTPYSSELGLELDLLAARGLADPVHEALDHAELDVALEQRQPDVAQGLVDDGVVEFGLAGQALLGGAEAFGEGLEHGRRSIPHAVNGTAAARVLS